MPIYNGTEYTEAQEMELCSRTIGKCQTPTELQELLNYLRDKECEGSADADTVVGAFVTTNGIDGDGIIVLTADVLDINGDPTGDTRTITVPEPTDVETDGVHFSGQPTIDAAGIVTYPQVNDLDESVANPLTLDLSSLISSPHPEYLFSGDLTIVPNSSGGFDVSYDDPDIVAGTGVSVVQNAAGDWVISAPQQVVTSVVYSEADGDKYINEDGVEFRINPRINKSIIQLPYLRTINSFNNETILSTVYERLYPKSQVTVRAHVKTKFTISRVVQGVDVKGDAEVKLIFNGVTKRIVRPAYNTLESIVGPTPGDAGTSLAAGTQVMQDTGTANIPMSVTAEVYSAVQGFNSPQPDFDFRVHDNSTIEITEIEVL